MIPKYTSQVVNRFIKPLSQPYHDLANAFASNNSVELNAVLNKHTEVKTLFRYRNILTILIMFA